jgi:hypothetical protein
VRRTTLKHPAPYVERFSLGILIPYYLFIGQVALVGGFSVVMLSIVGMMQRADPPANPFAVYADILPGQPITGLATHGFNCTNNYAGNFNHSATLMGEYCTRVFETGAFSRIVITQVDGVINLAHFSVRDNMLSVGDLAIMLGISDIHRLSHKAISFRWRGRYTGTASIVNPRDGFFAARHIHIVTLTNHLPSSP